MRMTWVCRLALIGSLLSLMVMPGLAQIENGLDFVTTFPFYAGNAKMPAGAYMITEPAGFDETVVQIMSKEGTHAAFIDVIPTQSEAIHKQSDVLFNRYGKVEFLTRIWVGGQRQGLQVTQTKAEQQSAAKAAAVQHSVSGTAR